MSDFFGSLRSMIQLAQMMNNLHNNGLIESDYLNIQEGFSNIQFMDILNQPLQNQNESTMTQVLNNSFETMEEIKNPTINEEGKKQIKLVEYKLGDYDVSSCPITTEKFKQGDVVSLLPCNHIFDTDAINHWLENINGVCPLCRYQFPCNTKRQDNEYSQPNQQTEDVSNIDVSRNEIPVQNISYHNYRNNAGLRIPLSVNNIGMNYYNNFVNQVIQNQIEENEELLLQQVLMNSINESNNENEDSEYDISQND